MLKKNQYYCRGQLFRLDFIEKCRALDAKGVIRVQRITSKEMHEKYTKG